MSKSDRAEISAKVDQLLASYKADDDAAGVPALAGLAKHALVDLNRIADALEIIAAPAP